MKKNRREFISEASTGAVGLSLLPLSKKAQAGPGVNGRPNVLIVLDDQERFPMHLPQPDLPQRERLRKSSVEFTNNYCTYPLCSPSRSTCMTGLYPHQAGINNNVDFNQKNPSLEPGIPNLASVFKNAGYETGYFGKWHLTQKVHTGGSGRTLAQYGFTDGNVCNQVVGWQSDQLVARNAARWVRSRKKNKPWFLIVCPVNPHDICFPQFQAVYRNIPDREVALPPNFEEDLSGHPEAHRTLRYQDSLAKIQLQDNRDDWLDYLRFYLYLIEGVDKNLGRVLDGLEESGQWDNTIVVFTADHGEMGASHGLVNKGFIYEECLHIPLWISIPWALSGHHIRSELTSNLDLVPTLCNLTGIKWPTPLPGMDLLPLKRDSEIEPRPYIFCEGGTSGVIKYNIPWRGVHAGDWKYCLWQTGEEELYSCTEDPLEMQNLADDPNALDVKKMLKSLVQKWCRETGDRHETFVG